MYCDVLYYPTKFEFEIKIQLMYGEIKTDYIMR